MMRLLLMQMQALAAVGDHSSSAIVPVSCDTTTTEAQLRLICWTKETLISNNSNSLAPKSTSFNNGSTNTSASFYRKRKATDLHPLIAEIPTKWISFPYIRPFHHLYFYFLSINCLKLCIICILRNYLRVELGQCRDNSWRFEWRFFVDFFYILTKWNEESCWDD